MTEPATRPARVRVTAPRTGHPRRTTVASEIDAQTQVGEIFMRSLMRSQLRLAFSTVLLVAGTVGLLPVLFLAVPGSRTVHVLGIPLPWLLLGFAVHPFLLAVAWLHVRRAERNEAAFLELARTTGGGPS
ncbi:MAG: hypothetical protein ACTHNS_11285 [Marmoricola sp.]